MFQPRETLGKPPHGHKVPRCQSKFMTELGTFASRTADLQLLCPTIVVFCSLAFQHVTFGHMRNGRK